MHDITDILAFEVKKELADRYFGFRKQIEADTDAYLKKLSLTSLVLENGIGHTLIRCYLLLDNKDLIERFLTITGLPDDLYYDAYLLESRTIRRKVFAGANRWGITRKGQFINLLLDNYSHLKTEVDEYRINFQELSEEFEVIREEINLFYRKNDIDTILSFLRRLDQPAMHQLSASQPPDGARGQDRLTDQLRIEPPRTVEEILPPLPSLPEPQAVRRKLKQLATEAFSRNPTIDLKALTRPAS